MNVIWKNLQCSTWYGFVVDYLRTYKVQRRLLYIITCLWKIGRGETIFECIPTYVYVQSTT